MRYVEATPDEESKNAVEPTPRNPPTESVPRKPGSKAQGRKRTKTGCLTCRKRRIKCGEEKPTCLNCVKSKRQCEGYNQRVVFKDPLSLYRPSFVSAFQNPHTQSARRHEVPHSISVSGVNQSIAPKPPRSPELHTQGFPTSASASTLSADAKNAESIASYDASVELNTINYCAFPEPHRELVHRNDSGNDTSITVKDKFICISTTSSEATNLKWQDHNIIRSLVDLNYQPGSHTRQDAISTTSAAPTSLLHHVGEKERIPTQTSRLEPGANSQANRLKISDIGTTQPSDHLVVDEQPMNWDEDYDDPFDISDDEVTVNDSHWNDRDERLRAAVALQASQDNQGISIRSFTSFIDRPNMLAEYTPAPQSTPLQDPLAARIFCHFVNVIGPSISMFERHPANPSLVFRGTPIPRSQQHIWTYTFPTLALHSPALLHAMMALSSLHISKLQNGPVTPSLKHYAIGLRRIAKTVSSETRRRQPATLAAAMLLAFYECWSADHQKWSNHLLGAKQLVCEIDFAGMTKKLRKQHVRRKEELRSDQFTKQLEIIHNFSNDDKPQEHLDDRLDEEVVSILMGKKVLYDDFGHVTDNSSSEYDRNTDFTERDLENYETQRDLFWWYCKQDVYQSILGGGHLFMDFSYWSHCPPRAPLGRLNAIYGSFDHLVLLMGRLAAFAAKDLKRKRCIIRANGGHWQHSEVMGKQFSGSQNSQMPHFTGMVPDIKEAEFPMGFRQDRRKDQLPQIQKDDVDLETQTQEAEIEWQEIRNAFTVLEAHFGLDFQPLGPEFSQPIQTPFGLALQFRTYSIAGVWMNFYMALIFCHRSHPAMPPAAMVAAGHSARQTAPFANRLGQIAAGIAPDCHNAREISPGIGAALIESATCLFVAGIQYQDSAQRFWTVSRLRNIARLTGWQTALAIALGCEKTWTKAGELGRSPPYTPTHEEQKLPDIGINSRRIDRAFSGKSSEERRLVIEKPDRVHYALAVLGLEGDFENLDLDATDSMV